jgi:16S rRNA (guanine(966)-N(2))-methyltransferase RsmD
MGQIRIIGGFLGSRKMVVPQLDGLRPTSDRMRETLFNWLGQDLTGKICLDLFAGSGILGIESLSRGAERVDFVEKHPKIASEIQKNLTTFSLPFGWVYQTDAREFLRDSQECYDIIFCDPPFHQGQINHYLDLIRSHLRENGVVYLETEKNVMITDKWQVLQQKQTQQACCRLLYLDKKI